MTKKPGEPTAMAKQSKKPENQPSSAAQQSIRTSKKLFYKRFRHPKPSRQRAMKLPSAWRLTKTASQMLWQHKKVFVGLTLIYALLSLVLVQGLASNTDVPSLKQTLNQAFTGQLSALLSGLSVFVILVGSAGSGSSQAAGVYQLFLGLVTSLAVIWALRQLLSGTAVRIRDTYYHGMYPLIPFILVLLVVGLQLIPLLIGSTLYSLVITNGIAVYLVEKILWAVLFAALALWSLYMVSASLFALYIVTLPDMTPMKALRSARELVRQRRWTVLRKILFLPLVLLVGAAVIMLPVIILVAPLAQWVFFLLSMFALVAVHAYMYTLYRGLLDE